MAKYITNASTAYDVRRVTDNFREHVLNPAGFSDLPIWMTEYEPNPSGILPTYDTTRQ